MQTKSFTSKKKEPDDARCRRLPQHLLLYLALFCSIAAIAFSIQTHLSTDFATLSKPIDAGMFYKNVLSIGLSSWKLCGVKHDIVDEILDGGVDSVLGWYGDHSRQLSHDANYSDTETTITYKGLMGSHRALRSKRSSLHDTYIAKADELDLDDVLVSADFPYRDDDEVLMGLPVEYWSCQKVEFTSEGTDDMKWVLARSFFVAGNVFGVTGFCFLVLLIISRGKRVNNIVRRARRQQKNDQMIGLMKEAQQKDLHIQSLDTISAGYRPISSLFLLTYLLQCVTFIFFDTVICKHHVCHISTGAKSLLAACILWVMSGVFVYLMMRKIWRNQKLVRQYNRQGQKVMEVSTFELRDENETSSLSSKEGGRNTTSRSLSDTTNTEMNDTSDSISSGQASDSSSVSLGSLDTNTPSIEHSVMQSKQNLKNWPEDRVLTAVSGTLKCEEVEISSSELQQNRFSVSALLSNSTDVGHDRYDRYTDLSSRKRSERSLDSFSVFIDIESFDEQDASCEGSSENGQDKHVSTDFGSFPTSNEFTNNIRNSRSLSSTDMSLESDPDGLALNTTHMFDSCACRQNIVLSSPSLNGR